MVFLYGFKLLELLVFVLGSWDLIWVSLMVQKWSFWCPETILFNSVCSMPRPCFAFRMGMPRPAPFDSLCLISCVESRGSAFGMSRHLPQEMQVWLVFGILKSCLMWGWSWDFVKWILSLELISFEFRLISRVVRSYFGCITLLIRLWP